MSKSISKIENYPLKRKIDQAYERANPVFKEMVKVAITPMLSTLSLMDYAESENEVLTVGISLIILNGLMYVGIPVFAIILIKKQHNTLF